MKTQLWLTLLEATNPADSLFHNLKTIGRIFPRTWSLTQLRTVDGWIISCFKNRKLFCTETLEPQYTLHMCRRDWICLYMCVYTCVCVCVCVCVFGYVWRETEEGVISTKIETRPFPEWNLKSFWYWILFLARHVVIFQHFLAPDPDRTIILNRDWFPGSC